LEPFTSAEVMRKKKAQDNARKKTPHQHTEARVYLLLDSLITFSRIILHERKMGCRLQVEAMEGMLIFLPSNLPGSFPKSESPSAFLPQSLLIWLNE